MTEEAGTSRLSGTMTTHTPREPSAPNIALPPTLMAPDIDWLNSQASLSRVTLFSSGKTNCERKRKLVCFVDVNSLSERERDQHPLLSEADFAEPPEGFDLEEKEVVVIRDENRNTVNTEGTVCFFRQGQCDQGDVMSWLSSDLQKYAVGFQHALTAPNNAPGPLPSEAAAGLPFRNTGRGFNRSGA